MGNQDALEIALVGGLLAARVSRAQAYFRSQVASNELDPSEYLACCPVRRPHTGRGG